MSRQHKQDYRGTYRRESGRVKSNKRSGWGMGLYRNTRDVRW